MLKTTKCYNYVIFQTEIQPLSHHWTQRIDSWVRFAVLWNVHWKKKEVCEVHWQQDILWSIETKGEEETGRGEVSARNIKHLLGKHLMMNPLEECWVGMSWWKWAGTSGLGIRCRCVRKASTLMVFTVPIVSPNSGIKGVMPSWVDSSSTFLPS